GSRPRQRLAGWGAGVAVGGAAAWAARRRPDPRRQRRRRLLLGSGVLAVLTLAVLFALLTGPHDLDRYPAAGSSPYRLPWPGGLTRLCVQGNRGLVSHRGRGEFAYDFAMPVGSHVCAARAGLVTHVEEGHDRHGVDAPNNFTNRP